MIAAMSDQLPPVLRHVLVFVCGVVVVALCLAILIGRENIVSWWEHSPTVDWLRWRAGAVRAALAWPLRLLRKRHTDISAETGVPRPPVSAETPTKDTP